MILGQGLQEEATTDESVHRYPTCRSYSYRNSQLVVQARGPNEIATGKPQSGAYDEEAFSAAGRLINRARMKDGFRLEATAYGFDRLGNPSYLIRYVNPDTLSGQTKWNWTYDSLGHVLEANETAGVTRRFIAAPYGPMLGEPLVTPNVAKDILSGITVQGTEPQLTYSVPDSLFHRLFERVSRMTAEPWEMDPTWDLGGYTIAQLHRFRVALDTLCVIHGQVSRGLRDPRKILESIIKVHPRSIWERILTRKSKLPAVVVATILTDLIYDPELYGPGTKQPHITFHPIFRLGSNLLGVSNWLFHTSHIDRNVWDLVSIIRPQLHSRLRNLKETSWIEELEQKAQQLGLKLSPNIKFEFGGQKSDFRDGAVLEKAFPLA